MSEWWMGLLSSMPSSDVLYVCRGLRGQGSVGRGLSFQNQGSSIDGNLGWGCTSLTFFFPFLLGIAHVTVSRSSSLSFFADTVSPFFFFITDKWRKRRPQRYGDRGGGESRL